MIRPFSDVDLHAYVDGQIGPERRAAVEAYLATAPADAARVAQWQRQNETVQGLFAACGKEPVPLWLTVGQIASARVTPVPLTKPAGERTRPLQTIARRSRGRSRRAVKPWPTLALAFAVGAAVAAAGLTTMPWAGRHHAWSSAAAPVPTLGARAIEAQALFGLDSGQPIYRSDVTADEAEPWLRKHLTFPLRIPDLKQQGWTFRGARLVGDATTPAALLLYVDGEGDRLSLFAAEMPRHADTDARATFDGRGILSWIDNNTGFAALTSKSPSWLVRHGAWLQDTVEAAEAK